jgi:hypothetical protein
MTKGECPHPRSILHGGCQVWWWHGLRPCHISSGVVALFLQHLRIWKCLRDQVSQPPSHVQSLWEVLLELSTTWDMHQIHWLITLNLPTWPVDRDKTPLYRAN